MNTISKKKKKPGPVKDKPKKKPAAPAKEGEEALPKQPFLKRLIFGEEKPDLSEIEARLHHHSGYSVAHRGGHQKP